MKRRIPRLVPCLRELEDRINCSGTTLVVKNALDYDPNYDQFNLATHPIQFSLRAHLKTAMDHYIASSGADIDTIVFNIDPSQGTDFSQPQTINLKAALGGTYKLGPSGEYPHIENTYHAIQYPVVIQAPRVELSDPSLPFVTIRGGATSWKNVPETSVGYSSDWSAISINNNIAEGRISIEGLKITGGKASSGAGIQIYSRGAFQVSVLDCEVTGNQSARTPSSPSTLGAGIFMSGDGAWSTPAKLTIAGSKIYGNSTHINDTDEIVGTDQGGGVYVGEGCSLVISATTFEDNFAENGGGAVYFASNQHPNVIPPPAIYSTELRIAGCMFSENSAISPKSSSSGGAILMGGSMTGMISDTTFSKNSATGSGGAMAISDGDSHIQLLVGELNIIACTFSENTGAIVPDEAPPSPVTTWGSGGALFINTTANRVFVVNSTFSANRVDQGEGGAIAIDPSRFTYQHRLQYAIKSYDSRALELYQDQILDPPGSHEDAPTFTEIANCTIADNYAGGVIALNVPTQKLQLYGSRGGGIAVFTSELDDYVLQGTVRIHSTIVADNSIQVGASATPTATTGSGPDIWVADDTVTVVGPIGLGGDHNLIGVRGDATAGSGHFVVGGQKGTLSSPLDPLLGPLTDNGGMTLTRAITSASPAYNNGAPTFNNGTATPYMTLDQRFGARKIGSEVDVGAYEWQVTVKSIKIDNGDIATYGPTAENSNQRSEVRRIIVTFSEPVNFTGVSAFKLHRDQVNSKQAGPDLDVALVTSPVAGVATTVTITFTNSPGFVTLDPGASVPDGLYDFTIIAANVTVGGVGLNGNGFADGTDFVEDSHYEGNQPVGIWRIFGDGDGTGISDLTDFAAFRTLFNLGANAIFDFDNDGNVGLSDFAAFITRFNLTP